jgi:cytidylate kinase
VLKDKINIAIDGPVASGKTTIGKKLARQINYQFLDSGLLFRHFAKFYQERKRSELDQAQVIKLSEIWQKESLNNQWEFSQQLENQRSILSSSAIGNLASQLAPLPELRQIICDFQRELTQGQG